MAKSTSGLVDSKETVIAIGIVVVLIALAISWFFIISPKMSEMSEANDRISAAQQGLDVIERNSTRATEIKNTFPEYEKRALIFKTGWPTSAENEKFLEDITKIGSQNNVKLGSITTSRYLDIDLSGMVSQTPGAEVTSDGTTGEAVLSPSAVGNLAAIPFTMSVSGSIPSINKFIEDVEGMPRAVSFRELSLTDSSGSLIGYTFVSKSLDNPMQEVADGSTGSITTPSTAPSPAASS